MHRQTDASINWMDLQCLEAFERSGSLQEAATLLGVNHTTVSRRIRQLEARLGCKLIETINGRLHLTTDGRRAAEACERISAETFALERELKDKDEQLSGTIRIGLLDVFVDAHAELFAAFAKLHPRLRLVLRSSGSQLHSLIRREADVALRVARAPRDTLVGRKLGMLQYAPFVREDLAGQDPFDRMPWVGWDSAVGRTMVDQWMTEKLQPGQVQARVDTTSAMMRLVAAGAGAAILPIRYARSLPEVVQLGEPLDGFETFVWILTHRDLAQLDRIRRLMQFVAERLEL